MKKKYTNFNKEIKLVCKKFPDNSRTFLISDALTNLFELLEDMGVDVQTYEKNFRKTVHDLDIVKDSDITDYNCGVFYSNYKERHIAVKSNFKTNMTEVRTLVHEFIHFLSNETIKMPNRKKFVDLDMEYLYNDDEINEINDKYKLSKPLKAKMKSKRTGFGYESYLFSDDCEILRPELGTGKDYYFKNAITEGLTDLLAVAAIERTQKGTTYYSSVYYIVMNYVDMFYKICGHEFIDAFFTGDIQKVKTLFGDDQYFEKVKNNIAVVFYNINNDTLNYETVSSLNCELNQLLYTVYMNKIFDKIADNISEYSNGVEVINAFKNSLCYGIMPIFQKQMYPEHAEIFWTNVTANIFLGLEYLDEKCAEKGILLPYLSTENIVQFVDELKLINYQNSTFIHCSFEEINPFEIRLKYDKNKFIEDLNKRQQKEIEKCIPNIRKKTVDCYTNIDAIEHALYGDADEQNAEENLDEQDEFEM